MLPKDTRARAKDKRANWKPHPELMALKPGISGNTINGVGEENVRRPSPVYWQDPDTIHHGKMQQWFGQQDMIAEIGKISKARDDVMAKPLVETADFRNEKPANEWFQGIERVAIDAGADMIGVARFDPSWVYDTKKIPEFKNIIMLVVEQNYERMCHAPEQTAGAEVLSQYCRSLIAARSLTNWIRNQGWDAEPHGSPTPATFTMIPPAIAAGLGELGKHGSMINRKYGANFRLAAVLTDLPLPPSKPDVFGGDAFCQSCRVCEDACPPQAIAAEKQLVRGATRWSVDFDKCQPFFNEHIGCSICTTLCPWSLPGISEKLIVKMAARMAPDTSGI